MPAGIPLTPPPLACVQRARASRVRGTRSLCGAGETEYDAASIVGERVSCSGRSLSQFNLGSDAVPIFPWFLVRVCVFSVETVGFALQTERRESRSFQSLADEQKSDDEWVEGARNGEETSLRCIGGGGMLSARGHARVIAHESFLNLCVCRDASSGG